MMPGRVKPFLQSGCRVVRFCAAPALLMILAASCGVTAHAQPATFAGNAQHTALYSAPAQHLNVVRWRTAINLDNPGAAAHYGAPLVTASNTLVVRAQIRHGLQVSVFEGATGRLKYALPTDYIRRFPS